MGEPLDDHDRTRQALLEGEPWPGQDAHLAGCASCRDLVARLACLDRLLEPLRQVPPPLPGTLERLKLATWPGCETEQA